MRLETHPITARSFEKDYFIDGDAFERAYKLRSVASLIGQRLYMQKSGWCFLKISVHICALTRLVSLLVRSISLCSTRMRMVGKGASSLSSRAPKRRLSSKPLKEFKKTYALR